MLKDFHAGKRSPQRDPSDSTPTTSDGSSDPVGKTSQSFGVLAARKASRENAASPELTAEHKASSRVTHALSQVIAKRKADTGNNAAAAAATTTTTADVKPGVPPAPKPPAPPSHAPASDKPSSPSSSRKYHWVKKPAPSLQVGEKLTGFLKSEDGRSAFWPGVDGSLRFGKFATPVADPEYGVGYGVIRATNLLGSENEKAREALLMRWELREEGGGGGGGGGVKKKGDKVGGSWWSWRGRSKRRQRDVATENDGEVCVSVTNKGCVVSQPSYLAVSNITVVDAPV